MHRLWRFIAGACHVLAGILVLFPHDNGALQALQYLLLALTVGVTVTFFAGGFVLATLQED